MGPLWRRQLHLGDQLARKGPDSDFDFFAHHFRQRGTEPLDVGTADRGSPIVIASRVKQLFSNFM